LAKNIIKCVRYIILCAFSISKVFVLKETNTFIHQGIIKFVKSDSKDIL